MVPLTYNKGVFKYTYITEGAIKDVEWTVVMVILHVLNIVLHLHLDGVTIIILSTLEPLIPVLPCQTLHRWSHDIPHDIITMMYIINMDSHAQS